MLRIIEFLFYFVRKKYQKWGAIDIAGVYALCFITLTQLFNIISLVFILVIIGYFDVSNLKSSYAVILYFILLGLNYGYVYKVRGQETISTVYDRADSKAKRAKTASLIYVVMSYATIVLLLIYHLNH